MATDKIEKLIDDGIVDELVQRVKTGKEAEVYVVRRGTEYLAAKVYKERTERNFKNNVGYREGRAVRNTRDMRAIAKRTKYGTERAESDWMHTEHDACVELAAAGVRVPRADLFYEGVFLMELVLDADGSPAPRLIELAFTEEEALALHADLTDQIIRMLLTDRIHGDLSAYNILMAWNGATIIDFPQVVSAAHNSQAEMFLTRDVRNVTEFLARFAPSLKARSNDGRRIWRAFERRELQVGFIPADHPELDAQANGRGQGAQALSFGQGRREIAFDRPARPPRPEGPRPPRADGPRPPRDGNRPPRPEGHRPPRPPGNRSPRPQSATEARPTRNGPSDRDSGHPAPPAGGRHVARPHAAPRQAKPQEAGASRPAAPGGSPPSRPRSRHRHQQRRSGSRNESTEQ